MSMVHKNENQDSNQLDIQNSQNHILQNNDSSRNNGNNNRNSQAYRKTSKRRQAQQQKAVVLQLFKDLMKVVNESKQFEVMIEFQSAYLSPPKPKVQKPPKLMKNQSLKPSKKQQSLKPKKQEANQPLFHPVKQDQRQPQSKEVNQVAVAITTQNIFQPSSSAQQSNRKGSQSHSHHGQNHKQKNPNYQLLTESLKKEIFTNYSVIMKYTIHEDIEQEIVEEAKENPLALNQNSRISGDKIMQQENEDKNNAANQLGVKSSGDLIVQEQAPANASNIQNNQMDIENNNLEVQMSQESSSSSSCQQNQVYPPHAHMPQGHASTTQQFLQQHHPVIGNLPHSSQSLNLLSEHPKLQDQNNITHDIKK